MAQYCGLDKKKVWELTLPQLNYLLKECKQHVEFTIKVYQNPLTGLIGGGAIPVREKAENTDKSYEGEYEVATEEDMQWLASIL